MERQAVADGLEYYFAQSDMKNDEHTLRKMKQNMNTGLRRMKTMKSNSSLQSHLAVKGGIDNANNEAYEMFKSERKVLKATFSDKEYEDTIAQIRNPLSKYTAVQQGVASASARYSKRRKRSEASQLNQALL